MNTAIILCGGNSTRMNYIDSKENKVFIEILGKPIIYYTIKNFEDSDSINSIIIVAREEDIKKTEEIIKKYKFKKIKKIVAGGKGRQDSAYNGLKTIENVDERDIVLFHNGCNPFVSKKEIETIIRSSKEYGAAALAFPAKDTIKKVNEGLFVEETIDRKNLWQMQTPQAMKYYLAIKSFEKAKADNFYATDDISLVERLGKKVKIVSCSYKNIKITTKDDLRIAEGIIMEKGNMKNDIKTNFRIGFGQDSHAFSKNKNKKLVLGGYVIENETGMEADSDGDVILHALFNAISQAIAERSLDYYANEMFAKGVIDSKEYLKVILNKLKEKNMKINNIGIMIEAKKPKLEPYTDKIKESLSKVLGLDKEDIGITYTTGDNLTAFGKGKGIQCFAVVTIKY